MPKPFSGPQPAGAPQPEGICALAPDVPQCSRFPTITPRCNASDPECGPEATGEAPHHTFYREGAPRKPFAKPSVLASRPVDCAYDGEYMPTTCDHNGCVEGHCTEFRQ